MGGGCISIFLCSKLLRLFDLCIGLLAPHPSFISCLEIDGVVDSAKLPLLIAIICPGFCAAIIRKSIREFQILLKVEERGDFCIL